MDAVPESMDAHWVVRPSERMVIGPGPPRLLLLVEALRDDIQITMFKVTLEGLEGQAGPQLFMGDMPPLYGVRRFKVLHGDPAKQCVRACGNFPMGESYSLKVKVSCVLPPGHDYWLWCGGDKRLRMDRGEAMAIWASAGAQIEPCRAKVEMCGVELGR